VTEQQTLAGFLVARLDEDEAAATEAGADEWNCERAVWMVTDSKGEAVAYDEGKPTEDQAAHIARHDPARVLREVAAKRAILELANEVSGLDMSVDLERRVGQRDQADEPYVGDLILRQLAAAYSNHKDFRPEWAE
jgi:hypothetical protein